LPSASALAPYTPLFRSVGSFQYAALVGDEALVRRLADHAIARHHPAAADAANPYLGLFEAVISVQARLVARWMLVGFVHGVMNTDNTTMSVETIDYGPCAFLDVYDPATVFSSIVDWGRYTYGNQPAIAGWNLARFAEALLPLLADDTDRAIAVATQALQGFPGQYEAAWTADMRTKLGFRANADIPKELIDDLLAQLIQSHIDYTSFFRTLSRAARGDTEP